jgi:tetratricopeptide (TPR) repeat protein
MTMPKRLCLNMIVKNEMANLERCLGAVADHIACWVIGDTGSTDGTQDFIRAFFARRDLPGELHQFPFINFEQARNEALERACASPLTYDYLLFDDADMELVVEDADFRARLEAPGYQLVQRASSGLVYWNVRLARRDAGVRYRGVTHEYLDVPGGTQRLEGVWYRDHASGANRVDKFERDIRLLLGALEQDPDNVRAWFYLAQSYRDAGRTKEAAEAYAKRAGMGGWDEEAWNARLQEARCLRSLGDEAGFLRAALAAYDQRPTRAEPLYDLARFYRERGMHDASVLFSEPGLALKRPEQDILFIEDFVYTAGMREEFSISANYSRDPIRKDRGHAVCDSLALSREVPDQHRGLARSNLFFYTDIATTLMPSFHARPVGFSPPDGWQATNPSVARQGERLIMLQRCVNYAVVDNDYRAPDGTRIDTRNFLLGLNADLDIESATEILPPADLPPPAFDVVLGCEDARLFAWRGELWCNSTIRQLTPEGWCDQMLARIEATPDGPCRMVDWRVLRPDGPRVHEKNWMPMVVGDNLRFIYSCDPTRVLDEKARTIATSEAPIAAEQFPGGSPPAGYDPASPRGSAWQLWQFRGGTQAIEFDGGRLALIHERSVRNQTRYYWHRFVWLDADNILRRVSRRFYFQAKGVEFAAGIAWHPDGCRLVISFGVGDNQAWIATVEAEEVRRSLEEAEGRLSAESARGTSARQSPAPVARGAALTAPQPAVEPQASWALNATVVAARCSGIAADAAVRPPSKQTADPLVTGELAAPAATAITVYRERGAAVAAAETPPPPHTQEQPPQRLKIAVYTIALNEAHHVTRWRDSAVDADYLVVADTGSTDDTVERLTAAGVLVHQIIVRPWRFDDARNASLALVPADADICISLDMDEFMLPGWRAKLEAAWTPGTTKLSYNYARGLNADGSPARVFRRSKIHSRRGYRWKRIVHEDLQRTEPDERSADTEAVLMGEVQDPGKDRGQYLPLMEQAYNEDPEDAQICFWLARELMYAGQSERSAEKFLAYLAIPDWHWKDERAEAMRYLARVQPDKALEWLQKSIAEAGHRRELWLDLAELYHSKLDWLNLFWACTNGMEKTRRTGSYLDEPQAWGFRLHDLAALACSHLGLIDQAIKHGTTALELQPGDRRLTNNLGFYKSQLAERNIRAYREQLARSGRARTALEAVEQIVNRDQQLISLEAPMANAPRWVVCVIGLPGFIHSAALAEIAEAVFQGLVSLGVNVEVATDINRISGQCILIGAHLLSRADSLKVTATAIIYNSEHANSVFFQPNSGHFLPHYIDLLRRTIVWDYSVDNAQVLSSMIGHEVLHVPLGYVPQFTRISKQEEDIDVLFYGWPKPRRQAVLDDLIKRGLNVHGVNGVYGTERDRLIARSKVVLNIHGNLPGAFEIVRVGYLLANSKAVVSEVNPGESVDDDLMGAFLGVPYDELADATVALVQDYERRRTLEQTGFQRFRSRFEPAILRAALGERLETDGDFGASLEALSTSNRFVSRQQISTARNSIMDEASQLPAERFPDVSSDFEPYLKHDKTGGPHVGIPYIEFLQHMSSQIKPSSYLEIGTETGASLRQFECDALCIDPAFRVTQNVLLKRRRTFFFQMTSDTFFAETDPRAFFQGGVDLGFLDGLHHFEALLKDFINFERSSHRNSIAVLHDCLPTNLQMTSRAPPGHGDWTGDVWRILPTLKKYRPDLRILLLDCPPTGLVVCYGLDPTSTVLQDKFSDIAKEFLETTLDEPGLRDLRSMFPLADSRKLVDDCSNLGRLFPRASIADLALHSPEPPLSAPQLASIDRIKQDSRVASFVTFYYRSENLQFLDRVLRNLHDFCVGRMHVTVVTNADGADENGILEALCRNYFNDADFVISCFPNCDPGPMLTWKHKPLLREAAAHDFTHFIYTEDDIGLTFRNFLYFVEFADPLRQHGLIPGFLRTEFAGDSIRSCDAPEPTMAPRLIATSGHTFVSPHFPYCACFVMDRLHLTEYLESRSFDFESSQRVSEWGVPERAAMGLCWETPPPGFKHRYVIPVDGDFRPLPVCQVQHMPSKYATMPNLPFGKLPVENVFVR